MVNDLGLHICIAATDLIAKTLDLSEVITEIDSSRLVLFLQRLDLSFKLCFVIARLDGKKKNNNNN